MTPGDRDTSKLSWKALKAETVNTNSMNKALTSFFLDVIHPTYKKIFESDLVGRTNRMFWAVFQCFLTKYGKIKPTDIEANNKRLVATWNHMTLIENLFGKINNAHEYLIFTKKTIEDLMLVHTAEIQILKAGVFVTKYKDWRSLNEADRTWEKFQLWWQEAYNLKEETDFSASSYGFVAAAT